MQMPVFFVVCSGLEGGEPVTLAFSDWLSYFIYNNQYNYIYMITAIKNQLLTNWHPMRWVALGIGLFLAINGFTAGEPALGLLSLFFLFQAVTNTGCMVGHCAGGSCQTDATEAREKS